jgi:hypothetical protein
MILSMDREYAQELLDKARRDFQDAQVELEGAQATIDSTRLIVQGILRRFPDLVGDESWWWEYVPPEPADRPRGSEAVLQVLKVHEEQCFWIPGLVEALQELELLPDSANPANAVRTAVERLVADPESGVKKGRDRRSVFYWYSDANEEVVDTSSQGGYGFDEEPF